MIAFKSLTAARLVTGWLAQIDELCLDTERLQEENERLRAELAELSAELGRACRDGGPNTNKLLGAIMSGGDVLAMAEQLGEHETKP